MGENINHESTRMNTNEWALQPPWLLLFGAQPTRQPCGASVLRMRGTRHAACARSRTRLFRVHWCSVVVLKRTSPAFLSRNTTTDFPERQSRNQNRTATPKSETAAKWSGSGCGFAAIQ